MVATGISTFASRPAEFEGIPPALASHSSEHNDLRKFKGQRVVVIGAGQSALESAALFKEAGIEVEVIARQRILNWVGLHPRLHHLGPISRLLYSTRDVGPAGISRLVAMPHLFRIFPSLLPRPNRLPCNSAGGSRLAAASTDGCTRHAWAQGSLRHRRG